MSTINEAIEKLDEAKTEVESTGFFYATQLIELAITILHGIEKVTVEEYQAYFKEWHDKWYAEIIIRPKTAVEWPDYLADELNKRIFGE